MQTRLTAFHSSNGFLHRFQVAAVPFVGTCNTLKLFALDAATFQHLMHLFVIEGHNHAAAHKDANLGIEQLIGNACRFGVLANTLVSSLLQ